MRVILLLSLLLSITFCYSQKDKELHEKSIELLTNKKYPKALTTINKAIKINNEKSKYFITKGQILYEINKDLPEFFSYLSKSVEVEPESPIPLLERAFYYEKINKYQDAILDYNDALKLAKYDSVIILIHTNKGGVLTKLQRPELAHEILLKALAIDSNNIGVLNNLAMCLDDLGKREESFTFLQKIIKIDSTFHPAWINLGFQASLQGKYEDALKYLNQADKLEPETPFTLNNRGYVKFKLNDINGALEDINKSLELDATNSYAYRNKALIYLHQNNNTLLCENLYLAKENGFSLFYGDEVDKLIKENCMK